MGEVQGNTCRMMNLWNMLWALRLVSICTSRPARDSVAIPPIEEEEQVERCVLPCVFRPAQREA